MNVRWRGRERRTSDVSERSVARRSMPMLSRRELLIRGSALVGGSALFGLPEWARRAVALTPPNLPPPAGSGIDHIVVVMMENRSFDHFLGWLPGADGRQAGLSYRDPNGKSHKTFHQRQLNGCGFNDPDHSYSGGRTQYNGGLMDGFLTD